MNNANNCVVYITAYDFVSGQQKKMYKINTSLLCSQCKLYKNISLFKNSDLEGGGM